MFNSSSSRTLFGRLLGAIAVAVLAAGYPIWGQETEISDEQSTELFSQVDGMLASLSEITGLEVRKPVPRELLTRDEIRELIESRIAQESNPEKIRREELFLKLFGFVGDDFDLKGEVVDVLTEQAIALYDFKTRRLYLATWTPEEMQEFALVHELAHALADQHFNLKRFVKRARNSEEDIARSAVMEGQASWLMTEYVLRQSGRSMVGNRLLAIAAASASKVEADQFPVFSAAPLFLRETMLFPYAEGLLFQQEIIDKLGAQAFSEIFRRPPSTSQHILEPDSYLEKRLANHPVLPKLELPAHPLRGDRSTRSSYPSEAVPDPRDRRRSLAPLARRTLRNPRAQEDRAGSARLRRALGAAGRRGSLPRSLQDDLQEEVGRGRVRCRDRQRGHGALGRRFVPSCPYGCRLY